jgi:hypothetical protein
MLKAQMGVDRKKEGFASGGAGVVAGHGNFSCHKAASKKTIMPQADTLECALKIN